MTPPGLGGSPEAERRAEMLSSPWSRDQPRSPPAARWRHPGTSQKLLQTAEMFFRSALVMVADNKSLITNAKSPWTNGLSAHPHQAPQPLVAAGGTGSRSRWRENRAFASKQENKCPNCLPSQRCDFCPSRAIPRHAREQEWVPLSGAPAQQSLEMGHSPVCLPISAVSSVGFWHLLHHSSIFFLKQLCFKYVMLCRHD